MGEPPSKRACPPPEEIVNGNHEQLALISEDKLSLEAQKRYDRQLRVWGVEGQVKITDARVLIAGRGAFASEVAKNLVLAGVGNVTLCSSLSASPPTDEVPLLTSAYPKQWAVAPAEGSADASKLSETDQGGRVCTSADLAAALRAMNSLVHVNADDTAVATLVNAAESAATDDDKRFHVIVIAADGVDAHALSLHPSSTPSEGVSEPTPSATPLATRIATAARATGAAVLIGFSIGHYAALFSAHTKTSYTIKLPNVGASHRACVPTPALDEVFAALSATATSTGAPADPPTPVVSARHPLALTRLLLAALVGARPRRPPARGAADGVTATDTIAGEVSASAGTAGPILLGVAAGVLSNSAPPLPPARQHPILVADDDLAARVARWWEHTPVSVPSASVVGAIVANEVVGLVRWSLDHASPRVQVTFPIKSCLPVARFRQILFTFLLSMSSTPQVTGEGLPLDNVVVWDGTRRIAYVEELQVSTQ